MFLISDFPMAVVRKEIRLKKMRYLSKILNTLPKMRPYSLFRLLQISLLFMLTLGLLPAASAQGSGFGLGVVLGEPTGLSMKAWIGDGSAVDAAAAWSLEGAGRLHLHVDYLRHADVIDVRRGHLPFYYGIGARINIYGDNRRRFDNDDDVRLGLRVPLGLTYLFAGAPLDIFVEIAPVVELFPATDVDLDGGVGIRYYF